MATAHDAAAVVTLRTDALILASGGPTAAGCRWVATMSPFWAQRGTQTSTLQDKLPQPEILMQSRKRKPKNFQVNTFLSISLNFGCTIGKACKVLADYKAIEFNQKNVRGPEDPILAGPFSKKECTFEKGPALIEALLWKTSSW